MIKRAISVRAVVLMAMAVVGGCMPVSSGTSTRPTTATSGNPLAAVPTQPAEAAARMDRIHAEVSIAAATRSADTRTAEIPSSQPADVAALADRVGGQAGGQIVGVVFATMQGDSFERAKRANDEAEQRPAQVASVLARAVADLNSDGFITLDEITAMKRAGLDETQMLLRLRQSGAVFSATTRQQQYLLDRGVPAGVVKLIAAVVPDAATSGSAVTR